jgi:aldehyde dehydrogenase (NAD+)
MPVGSYILLADMDTRELRQMLERQRCRAMVVARAPLAERRERLRSLRRAVVTHKDAIVTALYEDLRRPAFESEIAEFQHVIQEIDVALRHLPRWMRPRRTGGPLLLAGTSSRLIAEPKGTVLILAPWNYPFALILNPLVAAIAAGNCAVVKPSEHAPATAELLSRLLAASFPPEEVTVVLGGPDTAAALVDLPFDHIFFTGSSDVGRKVMAAAARHLTSVTLELGGKTPAIVDNSADVRGAARAIVWAKYFNAGQTCLAPDYVLVHDSVHDRFVDAVADTVARFYGDSADARRSSGDFGRIVDDGHWARLVELVDDAVNGGAIVVCGGDGEAESRYFAPTVLTDVQPTMRVMQEEIFGPVLPVVRFMDRAEGLGHARVNGRPLGSYIFARERRAAEMWLRDVLAGGSVLNNTLLHYANPLLPFGGIGTSGMGTYHGYHGFLTMSHLRPVVAQRRPMLSQLLHPPYRGRVHGLVRWILPWLR